MRIKRAGAYQIVNEVNGKCYVGSSKDITNRWGQWRVSVKKDLRYKSLLQIAFRKYGIENFTFILLEQCEPTKEALEAIEQKYIDLLKPAYNILPKAYSTVGHKLTEEQKQLLRDNYSEDRKQAARERFTAYMNDPEIKSKYSELRKGKTFEEIFGEEQAREILARQSEGRTGKHVGIPSWNKGVPLSDEQKALLNAGRDAWQEEHGSWNKGIPISEETRQKISEALTGKEAWNKGTTGLMPEPWNKGIPASEEERRRLIEMSKANFTIEHQMKMTEAARQANLGKERSEETRQRIGESIRQSEAHKASTNSRRGIPRTEKVKQKVSDSLKISDKAAAYHAGRIGKSTAKNTSGHYGIVWDKFRNKWQVRANKKICGRFATIEEALACRDTHLTNLSRPLF